MPPMKNIAAIAGAVALMATPLYAQEIDPGVTDPVVEDVTDVVDPVVEEVTDVTDLEDPIDDVVDELIDEPLENEGDELGGEITDVTDVDVPDMEGVTEDLADLTLGRPGAAKLLGLDAPGVNKPHPGQGIGLASLPDIGVPPGLAKKGFGLDMMGGLPSPADMAPIDAMGAGALGVDAASAIDPSSLLGGGNGKGLALGRSR